MPPPGARPEIDRPLFIVGCGRSGTTLLYDMLAPHPELAWFSNVTQRLPRLPQLAVLSRAHALGALRTSDLKFVPRPREGHRIWDSVRSAHPGDNGPLGAADASAEDIAGMRRVVATHVRWHGRTRFMNKNTRNSRRIGLLDAAFPDAIFVHVVRDPRATVASLLRVAFWPDLPIWWTGDRTPEELHDAGWNPVRLAAEFWTREVSQVVEDLGSLDRSRSMTISYEELVEDPHRELQRLLEHAELSIDRRFAATLDEHRASSRNAKFREDLDAREVEAVEEISGPTAARVGYRLS